MEKKIGKKERPQEIMKEQHLHSTESSAGSLKENFPYQKTEVRALIREEIVDLTNNEELKSYIAEHEEFAGLIPHPDDCDQYEAILPGFVERMVKMAEVEQSNSYAIENKQLFYELVARLSQLLILFVIALLLGGGGMYLIYKSRNIEGLVALCSGIAAVLAAFRTAKR